MSWQNFIFTHLRRLYYACTATLPNMHSHWDTERKPKFSDKSWPCTSELPCDPQQPISWKNCCDCASWKHTLTGNKNNHMTTHRYTRTHTPFKSYSISLPLKCFYYLNQNQNPKTREYRIPIQMVNNPAQHVDRAKVLWSSDLRLRALNPPPVSWPQEFGMVVGQEEEKGDQSACGECPVGKLCSSMCGKYMYTRNLTYPTRYTYKKLE
jgi:hypothetical protein